MDSIPLHEGDPRWVFPNLMDTDAVREALDEARRIVEDLATQVGGNAGWTGCGLEFERYPSGEGDQLTAVVSGPEWDDAEFCTELRPAGLYEDDDPTTGWLVEATIRIRCDADVDCGMHVVERLPRAHAATPGDASAVLVKATKWLSDRALAEPRTYWREHDPESGHRRPWA